MATGTARPHSPKALPRNGTAAGAAPALPGELQAPRVLRRQEGLLGGRRCWRQASGGCDLGGQAEGGLVPRLSGQEGTACPGPFEAYGYHLRVTRGRPPCQEILAPGQAAPTKAQHRGALPPSSGT